MREGELDPVAADAVLHAAGHASHRAKPGPDGLTTREVEVLRLVAQGASNREIAAKLVISEKTARNHVERTYAKIGVSNRVAAQHVHPRARTAGHRSRVTVRIGPGRINHITVGETRAAWGNRTPDLLITSETLYRLS